MKVRVGALSSKREVYLSGAEGIESEAESLAFFNLSNSGKRAFPTDLVTSLHFKQDEGWRSRLCSSQNFITSDSKRSLASSATASKSILELDVLDLDLLLDLLHLDLERVLVLRDLDWLLRLLSKGDLDHDWERGPEWELLLSEYSHSYNPSSTILL